MAGGSQQDHVGRHRRHRHPDQAGPARQRCKREFERMDASISEVDEIRGHMPAYGKVAAVAVVGNEDGAQHVCAEVFQALASVRFTVQPAQGVTLACDQG